jgi:prepilin-type N-terminal cleavage/methylation domain-containing protein
MTMAREKLRGAAGFTLVEMLMVLLISSIVLLILGVIAKATFDVLRVGESRSQLNGSAQLTLDYIARDVESATSIPAMYDRNLTGVPDDDVDEHDQAARWILGYEVGTSFIIPTNYAMSEAFSDHLELMHSSEYRVGAYDDIISQTLSPPKSMLIQGMRVANWTSYYRLAIPTVDAPYYLSTILPWNRTPLNNYPQSVAMGYRDETAVATQDVTLYYRAFENQGNFNPGVQPPPGDYYIHRYLNKPIGTNITRIRFEYFMEVPVYKVDGTGDAAYRNLVTRAITYEDAPTQTSGGTADVVDDCVPIVDHYELRHIDVCDNSKTVYTMQDQYLNGGIGDAAAYGNWNIDFFWNEPARDPDNPPRDDYAFTTDGEFRAVRWDTAMHWGADNSSPTGWDAGNADGIPDGDGLPDDPVATYWLPFLRAIRVTAVATPTKIIEERQNRSGTTRNGTMVYYNLDSPVPYRDDLRTQPMVSARDLYVGDGKDIVMSRMVYPGKMYQLELIADAHDSRLRGMRRADWNFFRGMDYSIFDPLSPDDRIKPFTPWGKYFEKENR